MQVRNASQDQQESACEIFDSEYYLAINDARWEAVSALMPALPDPKLETTYDVGCGPAWFAGKFVDMGLDVTGLEARPELVAEAKRRVPRAKFVEFNADRPIDPQKLPAADFVFCFGLLYHLENPFIAVRNLRALTDRFCLIESIMIANDEPVARLTAESPHINQGLTYYALIPSCKTMVKMLYVSGFENVYEYKYPIAHQDFIETETHNKRRRVLLATDETVDLPYSTRIAEPVTPKYSNEVGYYDRE